MAPPTARVSVTAEVVGTGSDGTEPSLLFSVQRHGVYSRDVTLLKRYLFNCGEGTQRLCGENGVKLSSLDSIFFTRFDVHSVSGVPGMIFSLSTCGAASLRLHGPTGLHAFLVAIQSFVRRKYPRVLCIETVDDACAHEQQPPQAAAFDYQTWRSDEDQSDQHMRIFAVTLRAQAATANASCCLLCDCGDRVPAAATHASPERSVRTAAAAGANTDPDAKFRAWLVRFYTAKVPEKVPFVDVILSRHRGRLEDLRAQLEAKYGALDAFDSASSDSSSSDDDDDSDDSDSGHENSRDPSFDTLAFSREWLVRLYRRYQPEKLLHVDRVLKQFNGREETLKQMLLQKYWRPARASDCTNECEVQHELLSKRRKLEDDVVVAAASSDMPAAGDAVVHAQDEIPAVYVDPRTDDASVHASSAPSTSLCYIMKFLHDVHAVVWIIDCCDGAHISDLVAQFAASAVCVDHAPVLIVHFSPTRVVLDARYQTWMQSHASAQQLVFDGRTLERVDSGVYSWVFRASAKHMLEQSQLACGSDHAARLWGSLAAYLESQKRIDAGATTTTTSSSGSGGGGGSQRRILWRLGDSDRAVHIAQSKQRFELVRTRGDASSGARATCNYDRTGWRRQQQEEPNADESSAGASDRKQQQPVPTLSNASNAPASSPSVSIQHTHDARALRFVILGTGSAAPSRLRGSTGIYLELEASTPSARATYRSATPDAMLIDCGEGTFGQLWRQFGDDTAARIGALRCVWISHSHADHQCGLVRVLFEFVRYHARPQEQQQQRRHALLVIAPQSVLAYARSWMCHILDACGVREPSMRAAIVGFTTCREFNAPQHAFRRELFAQIGGAVRELISVPVWHCYDSYGLVLTLESGAKIVYSGDTRPCNQLIVAGLDAVLLIHEATFDDSMGDDAVKKKHCTVGEALNVARKMRAQEVVLTHFSQRYPKMPPSLMDDERGDARTERAPLMPRVYCAFDGFVHSVLL